MRSIYKRHLLLDMEYKKMKIAKVQLEMERVQLEIKKLKKEVSLKGPKSSIIHSFDIFYHAFLKVGYTVQTYRPKDEI